jgi:tetratricopeptide (TPR) repeat protein
MSHQANYLGDSRSAVHLARAARNGVEPCPSASAIADFAAMEARAAAAAGERSEALRALAEAEAAFERRDPENDPDWVAFFDPSEMADEIAHCLRDLGDYPRACQAGETCLDLAGPEYARSRVFSQIVLAQSRLGAGEPEEAARIGLQVVPQVDEVHSVRLTRYLDTLYTSAQPFNSLPVVAEFTQSANRVLSSRQRR